MLPSTKYVKGLSSTSPLTPRGVCRAVLLPERRPFRQFLREAGHVHQRKEAETKAVARIIGQVRLYTLTVCRFGVLLF